MRFRGKIIGCIMGLLCFGPIGAAFGFILGHLFDIGYFSAFVEAARKSGHTHAQKVFFENTFKVMGHIAKSDGHISRNEINTAYGIMSKMRLNALLKKQAIALFNQGKQPDFRLDHALLELREACHMQPTLFHLFLDIQWQIAKADGPISATKMSVLQHICTELNITGFQFYGYEQSYQRQYAPAQPSNRYSVDEAYQLLGVNSTATPDEIKQAYRRAMSQHHPDKLIAKGLPPEMIKVATQKTQQIKKAYDEIKNARGF